MQPYLVDIVVILIVVAIAMTIVARAVRVVPEYQRLVVFRLGQVQDTLEVIEA